MNVTLPEELMEGSEPLFKDEGSGESLASLKPPYGVALTRFGRVHRFPLSSFAEPSQKGGRRYMSLESKDEVIACYTARGDESVALATIKGRATIFSIHDVPLRQKSSKGCVGVKLMQGDLVLGFVLTHNPLEGLTVRTGSGREKLVRESHNTASKLKRTRRGGRGVELIKRGQFEAWDWLPIVQSPHLQSPQSEVQQSSSAEESSSAEAQAQAQSGAEAQGREAPTPSQGNEKHNQEG